MLKSARSARSSLITAIATLVTDLTPTGKTILPRNGTFGRAASRKSIEETSRLAWTLRMASGLILRIEF
jgi:hypothetical protein